MLRFAQDNSFIGRIKGINLLLPAGLFIIGLIGVMTIFSASGGVWDMGAKQHLIRLIAGVILMLAIAIIDFRVWFASAYPAYIIALLLLVLVEFFGVTINGSQRWLDLKIMRIQPSEFMKLASVMALARFYHDLPAWRVSKFGGVFGALLIISMPVILIMRQPDLGTAVLVFGTGLIIMFLAGLSWRIIGFASLASIIAIPFFFRFGLKPYQRERVLTFFNPERDPTGASYHIIQSKIALGSGGLEGKGYLQGTQSALKYVPENRTDFIFTVIGEEFGLIGSLIVISIYIFVIGVCFWLAGQIKHVFSRLLIFGMLGTFTLYIFVNLAMVMGLAPVVGVPLPLISYGGTVMMMIFAGFGIILSAHLYRDVELPRTGGLKL